MKKSKKWLNSLLWTSGTIGGGVSYLLTAQLSYALTESFSMSAVYVGVIFLISRIFDGTTDFIAGNIIDRTKTKMGKARIYDLFMIIAWVFIIFCFSVPNSMSEVGKIIFVFVMYNMYTSVFATFANCAETVRLKRSLDEDGRIHAVSISGLFVSLVSAVVSILIPILISIYGNQPGGWTRIALYFAIPCSILALLRFLFLPEQKVEEVVEKKEKVGAWKSVKLVLGNKYAIIVLIAGLMQSFASTASSSMTTYYFAYVYGDVSAASIPGLVSIVVMLSIGLMPKLVAKWGNSKTLIYTLILGSVASLLRYIMPTNIVWYTICTALYGLGGLPLAYLTQLMLIDTMQYGRWKTGAAPEGVYSSILSIAKKLGLGLGAGLMGVILQMGSLPTGGYTEACIKFLNNGFVVIGWLIAIIALVFYDLDKEMPQINKELSEQNYR